MIVLISRYSFKTKNKTTPPKSYKRLLKYGLPNKTAEEVPQNIHQFPSAKENIIMKEPQNIPIYTFSATLGHNISSIIIFLRHLL